MPWNASIITMTGASNLTLNHVISANAQDYDLFAEVGSPTVPVDLNVTLNAGVTIDSMTANGFAAGSNIFFEILGTIRGRGGAGGDGGLADGSGPAAMPGDSGSVGQHAFSSTAGVHMFLDMDSGNVWGGGGGGGGGAGGANVGDDQAGGGGGGGQGWNNPAGGAGGMGSFANGDPGTAGSSSAAGAGGVAGQGGDGGGWGASGQNGVTTSGIWAAGAAGGSGAAGGKAFNLQGGAQLTITGAKSIPTLESEGRLKGGTAVA